MSSFTAEQLICGSQIANGDRVLNLDGEGMFEVRAMPGKMFVVITKNLIIQGPGTKFRVDAVRSRREEVDLLEGQLKFENPIVPIWIAHKTSSGRDLY